MKQFKWQKNTLAEPVSIAPVQSDRLDELAQQFKTFLLLKDKNSTTAIVEWRRNVALETETAVIQQTTGTGDESIFEIKITKNGDIKFTLYRNGRQKAFYSQDSVLIDFKGVAIPNIIHQLCTGIDEESLVCEHCGKPGAIKRRQSSCYQDDEKNYGIYCPQCQKEADDWWDEQYKNL